MPNAIVKITAGDRPVQVQRMNPLTDPTCRIGPMITIPPGTTLDLHVFEAQGLAMREQPQ